MQLDNTQANIFKVNGGIADNIANRPIAQNTFYLFYSIDTQEIFYDNGSWILIGSAGGGGGANIYNTNGTLTGNRTLTGANNNLTFIGTNDFTITPDGNFLLNPVNNGDITLDNSFGAGGNILINGGLDVEIGSGGSGRLIFEGINTNIKTLFGLNNIGLNFDFVNEIYELGQINAGNQTTIKINDATQFINLQNSGAFGGGIEVNLSNNWVRLGDFFAVYGGHKIDITPTDINMSAGGINTPAFRINSQLDFISAYYQSNIQGVFIDYLNRIYQFGQINGSGFNNTTLTVNDNNQHFVFRANNPELILSKIGAQNEGSAIRCGNALALTTGKGDLGQTLIATGFDGSGHTILQRGATLTFPLRFNGIPDFIVVGGSGIQNLGTGTTGLYVTGSIDIAYNFKRIPYRETATDYIFNVRLEIHTQFGGVPLDIGIRTIYSSFTGSTGVNNINLATRINEFGTNYDTQIRELTITIPKTIAGNSTNYYKFDVLVRRSAIGNSSVIGAFINFSI